jgi:hypothetical protein
VDVTSHELRQPVSAVSLSLGGRPCGAEQVSGYQLCQCRFREYDQVETAARTLRRDQRTLQCYPRASLTRCENVSCSLAHLTERTPLVDEDLEVNGIFFISAAA